MDSRGSGVLARSGIWPSERSQDGGGLLDAAHRLLVYPYHCRSQVAGAGLDRRGHDHSGPRPGSICGRCRRRACRAHGFLPLLHRRPHTWFHEPLDDILRAGVIRPPAGCVVPSLCAGYQKMARALGTMRGGGGNRTGFERYPFCLDRGAGGRLLPAVGVEEMGRDRDAGCAGAGPAHRSRGGPGTRAFFEPTTRTAGLQHSTGKSCGAPAGI